MTRGLFKPKSLLCGICLFWRTTQSHLWLCMLVPKNLLGVSLSFRFQKNSSHQQPSNHIQSRLLRSGSTYSEVVFGHAKQVASFYYLKLQLILTDVFLKGIVIHMLFWSLLVSKIEKSYTRESTYKENHIKPSMVKIELKFTQYFCYNLPVFARHVHPH